MHTIPVLCQAPNYCTRSERLLAQINFTFLLVDLLVNLSPSVRLTLIPFLPFQVSLGSLRGHSGPNGASVLAKDLTSLSDLLATTNNVLHRNSNLRASLTISVKKPSLSRAGSNAAKATSTPKNVRKTPAKSKPSKEKMQKGCVKAEKNLGPRFATLTKDKVGNIQLSSPCLHGLLPFNFVSR